MAKTTADRNRTLTKMGVVGAIATAASAAFIGVSAGTANADEIRSDTRVSSRQAASTTSGGVRHDATWGEVRGADILEVLAQGEVTGSMIAVPSKPRIPRADNFRSGWHHGIQGGLR
ncbi:MAG: hypothetical protein U1C73_08780 [Dietzia sp.]|nr:hypothetical protein [Dietzia sp.]